MSGQFPGAPMSVDVYLPRIGIEEMMIQRQAE